LSLNSSMAAISSPEADLLLLSITAIMKRTSFLSSIFQNHNGEELCCSAKQVNASRDLSHIHQ